MVIDELVKNHELAPVTKEGLELAKNDKFKAEMIETRLQDEKVIIAKPSTFMNNSGDSVAAIANFYKIEPQNLWIVSDDLDICLGLVRIRQGDRSGGHKGLEDIIQKLGDSNFHRMRIGIAPTPGDPSQCEKPLNYLDAKEYVLEEFTKREQAMIKTVVEKASIYLIEAIKIGNLIATTLTISDKE
jgi:PTH1 family peptidyl-tRNA hydrolase